MFPDTFNLKLQVFVQLSKIQKRLTAFPSKIYFSYYGGEKFSLTDTAPTCYYNYLSFATIAQKTKPYELYTIVECLVEKAICESIKFKSGAENRFVA
jgi:hypothetical protein